MPTRFARLGRLVLSAVMVGTAVPAMTSWTLVTIDFSYIGSGDRVLERLVGFGVVKSVDGDQATVKMHDGSTKLLPVIDLTEM